MTRITEEDVEAMLESKEDACQVIMASDAFMVVTLEGNNVRSSRGYYTLKDRLALVGGLDLVMTTLSMETLSESDAKFVPTDGQRVN